MAREHGINDLTVRSWLERDTAAGSSEILETSRLRHENESLSASCRSLKLAARRAWPKSLGLAGRTFTTDVKFQRKTRSSGAQLRREHSTPIVNELFSYLDVLWVEKMTDPSSLLGKAIQYTREAEKELKVFLSHSDIPLSNNSVERAIRLIALGDFLLV